MQKLTEGLSFKLEFIFQTKEANGKTVEGKKMGVFAVA